MSNLDNTLNDPINNNLDNSYKPSLQDHDNIISIKNKLQDVKQITADNIDKVLERGEKIEILLDSSNKLQQSSIHFKRVSKHLKRKIYYRKIKIYTLLIFIIGIIIYFIAWVICGNASLKKCK